MLWTALLYAVLVLFLLKLLWNLSVPYHLIRLAGGSPPLSSRVLVGPSYGGRWSPCFVCSKLEAGASASATG